MRRTLFAAFRASPVLHVWAAEEDDPGAPDTTFKNLKPGLLLRWWRQIRQNAWTLWVVDEDLPGPMNEGIVMPTRFEQIAFTPMSTYGLVPGSYCDPILYNTKSTSPFRWHLSNNSSDIVGHWYMDYDELIRVKDWKPKDPNDPFEMHPRPPQINLQWHEDVDSQGNRSFKYKYRYDMMGPSGMWECIKDYPMAHHYTATPQEYGQAEPYGFKQGHLLRCNEEEEKVLRRIMEEEDKEWDMIKRTEIIQEPWEYPGKIRPTDLHGAVERAKARWRDQIREGRETNPELDPEYDLVQAGEFVEPRDGPRAEWRHLWLSTRKGKPPQYQVTFNDGMLPEDNENKPDPHPQARYERTPKAPPYEE